MKVKYKTISTNQLTILYYDYLYTRQSNKQIRGHCRLTLNLTQVNINQTLEVKINVTKLHNYKRVLTLQKLYNKSMLTTLDYL